ncbi:PadR family transcriptional regulator [Arthrobacter sp. TMN-49]
MISSAVPPGAFVWSSTVNGDGMVSGSAKTTLRTVTLSLMSDATEGLLTLDTVSGEIIAHALRLYLLAVLEEGPQHGYEIIRALTDRFGGTYSPSAGTVYPRLAKLQEERLLQTTMEGRRTVYSLTAAGRSELEQRRHELNEVQARISASVRRLADDIRVDVQENMRSLRADLAASAETAKTQAHHAARTTRSETVVTGKQLKEAEFLLQKFRDDLRLDLRLHAARNGLDELDLVTLGTVLNQSAIAIRASLKK